MFCMLLLLRRLELHDAFCRNDHRKLAAFWDSYIAWLVGPYVCCCDSREGNCSLHTTPSVKCYLGWLHTPGTTIPGTCQSTGAKWCCCHRPTPTPSSSFVRQLSYFQVGRCQPDPGVLVQVGQAPLSIRWPVHCAVVHDVLHRLVWRTTFAFRGGF